MNGRTPATKATTKSYKEFPSDSISSLLRLQHDPSTILEKDLSAAALDQTLVPRECSKKTALSKLSIGRQKLKIEQRREGLVHLPVNHAELSLSWEVVKKRTNKQWSEGQRTE